MQVAWFATKEEAVALEEKLHAEALAKGQKCARWAEIIEDKVLGFGVPVKERVVSVLNTDERKKVAEFSPKVPEEFNVPTVR